MPCSHAQLNPQPDLGLGGIFPSGQRGWFSFPLLCGVKPDLLPQRADPLPAVCQGPLVGAAPRWSRNTSCLALDLSGGEKGLLQGVAAGVFVGEYYHRKGVRWVQSTWSVDKC